MFFSARPIVFALSSFLFRFRIEKIVGAIFLLAFSSHPLRAQAGAPDPFFTVQPLSAYQVFQQPDGKILLTGGPPSATRLNTDGTVDTPFATSDEATDNFDVSLAISGSYAYVAQYPTNTGYTTQYVLRRYSWDTGQRDNTFESFTIPGTYITGFHVYANGKILVWGDVLYRRNPDGSVDNSFTPITIPANTSINCNFATDGTTYISGDFTSFGGVACNGLVRLGSNGAVDPQFLPNLGTGASIDQVFPESSGTLLVAFSSTQFNESVARVKLDGTIDTAFHQAVFGAPGYSTEYEIEGEMPNQKILLFGYITAIDLVPVGSLAELNSDGTLDTSFAPDDYNPILMSTTTFAYNPTILPSGKILLGGSVYRRDIQDTVPFIRLNADGTRDTAFDTIPENPYANIEEYRADAYCIQADGKIVADLMYYNPGGGDGGGGIVVIVGNPPSPPPTPPPFITRYLTDGNYPPHCPTVLTAHSLSPSLTHITWNAVDNETGYQVERNENGTWIAKATVGANVTSYDDTAADGATNFQYRVEAKNSNGLSVPSPVATATAPTSFTTFTATATSPTQVTLNWTAVTDAWRYDIYRYDGLVASGFSPDTLMTKIGTVSAANSSFVDSDLLPLTTYTYGIIAVNVAGTSYTNSNAVTPPDAQPPLTPGNFLAASASQQITLIWAPSIGATGYQIERSSDGVSGWQVITTAAANAYEFVDSPGGTPGQTFYYRISALDLVGSSPVSDVISALSLAPGWLPAGAVDASFSPLQPASHIVSDRMSPGGTLYYYSYIANDGAATYTLNTLLPDGLDSTIEWSNTFILDYLPFADGTYLLSVSYPNAIHRTSGYDAPFPTFAGGEVDHFLQLRSGQILVSGNFTTVNGQASHGIARVNSDGSLDTTFSMTSVAAPTDPIAPLEQSNGDLIVSNDGVNLVRLLPNGIIDPTFGGSGSAKLSFLYNPQSVEAIDHSDNIILAGALTQIDDGSGPDPVLTGIVRLTPNGHLDSEFHPGAGLPDGSAVNSITIDPAGRVLLEGALTTYNGIPCAKLIRLTSDGELDPSFMISPTLSAANFVFSADGKTFYMGDPLQRYFYAPTTTNTQTFAEWKTANGGSGSSSTPMVPNLLKYLCDINPSSSVASANATALPHVGMQTVAGSSFLTLSYRQNAQLSGTTVAVQTSTDLVNWQTIDPPDFLQQTDTDPNTNDPVMTLGVHAATAGHQYIRLKVVAP